MYNGKTIIMDDTEYGNVKAQFSELISDLADYKRVLDSCTIIKELGLGGQDVESLSILISVYTNVISQMLNTFTQTQGRLLDMDMLMAQKIYDLRDQMSMTTSA